jgi:hypothetical protein
MSSMLLLLLNFVSSSAAGTETYWSAVESDGAALNVAHLAEV